MAPANEVLSLEDGASARAISHASPISVRAERPKAVAGGSADRPAAGNPAAGAVRRNVWGIADQALISAANFALMVFVARALNDPALFGAFALVHSWILLANIPQSGLVTRAHNVLGASRHGRRYVRYTTATGFGSLLIALAVAGAALAAAFVCYICGWGATGLLLLAAAPAVLFWQLQEFLRRVLYTEGRTAEAFINDLISYGGQSALIGSLWLNGRLTGPLAFYSIAAAAGLAAIIGLWQLRTSLGLRLAWAGLRENWNFGKWLVGADVVTWLGSVHAFSYIVATLVGTAASGQLRAAQALFGPARVLGFFLETVLPIRFAKALANYGPAAMHEQLKRAGVTALPLLGAYCLLMGLGARSLTRLVYGEKYAQAGTLVALYAGYAFLSFVMMMIAAALTARRRTRTIFWASLWGGIVALATSWPLIGLFQTPGVIVCMTVGVLVAIAWSWISYQRQLKEEPA